MRVDLQCVAVLILPRSVLSEKIYVILLSVYRAKLAIALACYRYVP